MEHPYDDGADSQLASPCAVSPTATETRLAIFYATETGSSEYVAKELAREADALSVGVMIADLADVGLSDLTSVELAVFIASTTGDGDAPYSTNSFFDEITKPSGVDLKHLRFAVLALGDSTYERFCETGKRLDRALEAMGGQRILARVDCDLDYEVPARNWRARVLECVAGVTPSAASALKDQGLANVHGRHKTYAATVIENRVLTGSGSTKKTRHLALSVSDPDFLYEAGDALGVIVANDSLVVEALLEATGLNSLERLYLNGEQTALGEALRTQFEITTLTPRFVERWDTVCGGAARSLLVAPDGVKQASFLRGRHIIDVVRAFPAKALDANTLIGMLRPLQPRLYSIASSPLANKTEVHLAIAPVSYELLGALRIGVATGQLCSERAKIGAGLQVFIEPNPHFRLPPAGEPIIMIGAGTGVAPFRGFLQHRRHQSDVGKAWLFFGERNSASDFLYEDDMQSFLSDGTLNRLDTAFSRDGSSKVYVQDRMRENGRELASWIAEGAHVYVCGDAVHMAPDVNRALIDIVAEGLEIGPDGAEDYVAGMAKSGRYHRDVY